MSLLAGEAFVRFNNSEDLQQAMKQAQAESVGGLHFRACSVDEYDRAVDLKELASIQQSALEMGIRPSGAEGHGTGGGDANYGRFCLEMTNILYKASEDDVRILRIRGSRLR